MIRDPLGLELGLGLGGLVEWGSRTWGSRLRVRGLTGR